MAKGDLVRTRILKRIEDSPLTITVNYPPARTPVTGASPATAPSSPLTDDPETHAAIATAPTPGKPAVTLRCIWVDGFGTSVGTDSKLFGLDIGATGWVAGADALARVSVVDAAVLATDPYGDTVFTDAEYVGFKTRRYRVLSVHPVGASFVEPYTYYVWLKGAAKQ